MNDNTSFSKNRTFLVSLLVTAGIFLGVGLTILFSAVGPEGTATSFWDRWGADETNTGGHIFASGIFDVDRSELETLRPVDEILDLDPEFLLLRTPISWDFDDSPNPGGQTEALQRLLGVAVSGTYDLDLRLMHCQALSTLGFTCDSIIPALETYTAVARAGGLLPATNQDASWLWESCRAAVCWPGYTGTYQSLLDETYSRIPSELQPALIGVRVISGCAPYIFFSLEPEEVCDMASYDPSGWGNGGNPNKAGADWENTIWIPDALVQEDGIEAILLHEAAHAYITNSAQQCPSINGVSWVVRLENHVETGLRVDLLAEVGTWIADFPPHEILADLIAHYFLPEARTYYIGDYDMTPRTRVLLKDLFQECNEYLGYTDTLDSWNR
mgnify:CR=1 FL=1